MSLTGTLSGVSPVKPGDKVDCTLEDSAPGVELAEIEFKAMERSGRYEFQERMLEMWVTIWWGGPEECIHMHEVYQEWRSEPLLW